MLCGHQEKNWLVSFTLRIIYISLDLVKFKVRLPPTNIVNPPRNAVQFSHKAMCGHTAKLPLKVSYIHVYILRID